MIQYTVGDFILKIIFKKKNMLYCTDRLLAIFFLFFFITILLTLEQSVVSSREIRYAVL